MVGILRIDIVKKVFENYIKKGKEKGEGNRGCN